MTPNDRAFVDGWQRTHGPLRVLHIGSPYEGKGMIDLFRMIGGQRSWA